MVISDVFHISLSLYSEQGNDLTRGNWTQGVNQTYIRGLKDGLDVFCTSYVVQCTSCFPGVIFVVYIILCIS